tara:strand:+ start:70 stop:252 length:183 start_codon:yes stop_codon:yes gene_type:complete
MSDADYHEGYHEGIKNCVIAMNKRVKFNIDNVHYFEQFLEWIGEELRVSAAIKANYAEDE